MTSRVAVLVVLVCALASPALAAPPNPPTSLTAIVSGNNVTLNWSPPAGGTPPTSYQLLAALSPSGTPIASFPVPGTTLAVAGVPNGVYYVNVRAVNADGTSGPSNEVIVVVPGGGGDCTAPPNAPTNLLATVSGNQVALGWAAPSAGCQPTGYVIQAGSSPGLTNLAVLNVGVLTSLTVAAPPGTYFVRVVAVNAFGASAPSGEITVTVGTASRVTIGFDTLVNGPNGAPVTTYDESGFTLNATFGPWTARTNYGNPLPFIQFVRDAGAATSFGEVTLSRGGGAFTFESIDLYSSITTIPYQIIGLRGGATVLTLTGTVPNTFGAFAQVTNSNPGVAIDTLIVRLTNPGTACCSNPVGLDNIVVSR